MLRGLRLLSGTRCRVWTCHGSAHQACSASGERPSRPLPARGKEGSSRHNDSGMRKTVVPDSISRRAATPRNPEGETSKANHDVSTPFRDNHLSKCSQRSVSASPAAVLLHAWGPMYFTLRLRIRFPKASLDGGLSRRPATHPASRTAPPRIGIRGGENAKPQSKIVARRVASVRQPPVKMLYWKCGTFIAERAVPC
jgi:hypothetical protein